jgi:hypothetical protein
MDCLHGSRHLHAQDHQLGTMTALEEAQAKLALATLKLEKLHDDYQTVNPEAIYWLIRMKRASAVMREASMKLMELESIEIPSKLNEK